MYTRPKTQTTWGPLVRAHREAKALTRDELADASGISCSMITKVELGVRTPSPKILLNIGTTLTKLDRKAEAANVYQRYLDSPDADPAKQNEVKKVLTELDAAVAILELSVTPADAELQINDEDWVAAAGEPRHRVAAGSATVRARHPAYQPDERVVHPAAGSKLPVAIALVEIPVAVAPVPSVPVDDGLHAVATVQPPRSRIGALAIAHVDLANRGGAGLVGVTVDVTPRLEAQAAAILGPSYGGYAGASFAILGGRLRPIVSAGLPIFISGGARVALRGAGGVELEVNRHLALIAELGVEYLVNPEADVKHTLFIPAIGAAGRL
jgi:transcriptional regulator with XRE-family HTH domain